MGKEPLVFIIHSYCFVACLHVYTCGGGARACVRARIHTHTRVRAHTHTHTRARAHKYATKTEIVHSIFKAYSFIINEHQLIHSSETHRWNNHSMSWVGVHISLALGYQSNQIFYHGTKDFCVFSVKSVSSYHSGTSNFEMAPRFLDNLCTPRLQHCVCISENTLCKVPEDAQTNGCQIVRYLNTVWWCTSEVMCKLQKKLCVAIWSTQRAPCIRSLLDNFLWGWAQILLGVATSVLLGRKDAERSGHGLPEGTWEAFS